MRIPFLFPFSYFIGFIILFLKPFESLWLNFGIALLLSFFGNWIAKHNDSVKLKAFKRGRQEEYMRLIRYRTLSDQICDFGYNTLTLFQIILAITITISSLIGGILYLLEYTIDDSLLKIIVIVFFCIVFVSICICWMIEKYISRKYDKGFVRLLYKYNISPSTLETELNCLDFSQQKLTGSKL